MKVETWLPIPGYIGLYSVSDHGNVLSMNWYGTGMIKMLGVEKTKTGYLRVALRKERKSKNLHVHRLVMAAFVGPIENGMEVNHKNGIKTDNQLSNLEYCTSSQNQLHAYAIGLQTPMRGEKHGRSKLKNSEIIAIKNKLSAGMTQRAIALEYGVSYKTISKIYLGQRWAHLSPETLQ